MTEAEIPAGADRDDPRCRKLWFRRILTVLVRPHEVFEALRDDSDDAVDDRQEPILLVVILAGIAGVLSTGFAGHVMDNTRADAGPIDPVLIPAWAFIGGAAYGLVVYWLGGALLWLGFRSAESVATYRTARHVFGYAMAPLAVSLVLVPIRLAAFGTDMFRSGGADAGWPAALFSALSLAFLAWSVVLLAIASRALHDWPWRTALKAVAVALVVPAAVVAVSVVR